MQVCVDWGGRRVGATVSKRRMQTTWSSLAVFRLHPLTSLCPAGHSRCPEASERAAHWPLYFKVLPGVPPGARCGCMLVGDALQDPQDMKTAGSSPLCLAGSLPWHQAESPTERIRLFFILSPSHRGPCSEMTCGWMGQNDPFRLPRVSRACMTLEPLRKFAE